MTDDDDDDDSFIQAFTSYLQIEEKLCKEEKIQTFIAGLQTTTENLWFFDTGATHHPTHSRGWLHDYFHYRNRLKYSSEIMAQNWPLEKVL